MYVSSNVLSERAQYVHVCNISREAILSHSGQWNDGGVYYWPVAATKIFNMYFLLCKFILWNFSSLWYLCNRHYRIFFSFFLSFFYHSNTLCIWLQTNNRIVVYFSQFAIANHKVTGGEPVRTMRLMALTSQCSIRRQWKKKKEKRGSKHLAVNKDVISSPGTERMSVWATNLSSGYAYCLTPVILNGNY